MSCRQILNTVLFIHTRSSMLYGMLLRCMQFVYVVKYYSIENLYTIKLDLFYIWRLYRQVWISGTNKGDEANGTALCIQKGHNTFIASLAIQDSKRSYHLSYVICTVQNVSSCSCATLH
jgi:hypothetical protein